MYELSDQTAFPVHVLVLIPSSEKSSMHCRRFFHDSWLCINFCGGGCACAVEAGGGFRATTPVRRKRSVLDFFILSAVGPQIERGLSNKPLNLTAFLVADVR